MSNNQCIIRAEHYWLRPLFSPSSPFFSRGHEKLTRLNGNHQKWLFRGREDVRRRASQYSKGMRQKVGIAIALAKNATAILMDKPTTANLF